MTVDPHRKNWFAHVWNHELTLISQGICKLLSRIRIKPRDQKLVFLLVPCLICFLEPEAYQNQINGTDSSLKVRKIFNLDENQWVGISFSIRSVEDKLFISVLAKFTFPMKNISWKSGCQKNIYISYE